jgi:hypothetical protein
VSILETITDNKQRRQITPTSGSFFGCLSEQLLQIFERAAGEFTHPSQKALMLFRAT